MPKQRESKLSGKILTALRAEGWFAFKVHGGPTMMSGLPDIVCCAEGLFVGLETKNPESRNDTSTIQDFRHAEIREAQGACAVVCTVAEAVAFVSAELEKRGL